MTSRTTVLLVTMLIAACATVLVVVEAVRTGRLVLGSGSVADHLPEGFYGASFLPDAVVDNAGWIAAAGIVWIVAAALLVGVSAARSRSRAALQGLADEEDQ